MDAANQLRAQALAAKKKLGSPVALRTPYDPSALQARVLRHYNGGVTVADLDHMSYKRFFALVRELNLMLEQEHKQLNNNKPQSTPMEVSQALSEMPKPQEYDGEVYQII